MPLPKALSRSRLLKGWAYQYLGILCLSSFLFADFYFIARLGFEALTAISIISPALLLVLTLFLRFGTANTVIVAQNLAAEKSRPVGTSILSMSFVMIGLTAFWALFYDNIRNWLGIDRPTWEMVNGYLIFILPGLIGLGGLTATLSHARGLGHHSIIFEAMAIVAATNLVLDPILIFGLGPIVAYGINGAAIASGTAIWFSLAYVLAKGSFFSFRSKIWDLGYCKEIFYLGTPLALMSALVPLRDLVAIQNGSQLAQEALVALGIGQRFDLGIQLFFFAVVSVITPSIAFSHKKILKADLLNTLTFSTKLSLIYVLVVVTLLSVFSGDIVSLITDETQVKRLTKYFLLIVPWSYLFFFAMYIGNAWLTAIGQTRTVALIGVMTMLVQITSMQLLSKWYDFQGIAWSYLITGFLSMCLVGYFLRAEIKALI